ncbi:MAG: gamma-glutamyltransferase [Candidatus Bipolaricaulia bacterium]
MRRVGRSTVMSPKSMVATSQPLAVQAGLDILKAGGNAVDAAIAAAAVLNVVQPMSTGIGGDLFALVYHAPSEKLVGLNASGRAPENATVQAYQNRGFTKMPEDGILTVTVPGAPHGWEALLKEFGTKSVSELLQPAIEYAQNGFPVTEIISRGWQMREEKLKQHESTAENYLIDGQAPRPGQLFKNPNLARTFRQLARDGIATFYEGEIAEQIVKESEKHDGLLSLNDLRHDEPTWIDPISIPYRGFTVYELPPNTQGLITLLALNIVEGFDLAELEHNSAQYLHTLIEAIKLAFADGMHYIADPEFEDVPIEPLLSKAYAAQRKTLIQERASPGVVHGLPEGGTVYITVVDEQRNVASFIQSLFMSFGSGVTAGDTGILLQNRGSLFSLDPGHANHLEPGKRPYHTIIPAMVFQGETPWMSFGVVGGFMQPQGHLQLLCNLIDHQMDLQQAIEIPRFNFFEGNRVALEQSISQQVRERLRTRGHELIAGDGNFGGAQAIVIDPESGVLLGGSDPRGDGCAQGY